MESGAITDGQISASSILYNDDKYAAVNGRLNKEKSQASAGAWAPNSNTANREWLQVDLGGQNLAVTRVATQGRNNKNEWVTSYKLQYSNDGMNFQYYREEGQAAEKVKQMGLWSTLKGQLSL